MITIKKGYYQIDLEDGKFVLQYQDGIMFYKVTCDTLVSAIAEGARLKLKPNRYSLR